MIGNVVLKIEKALDEAKSNFWFVDGKYLGIENFRSSINLKLVNGKIAKCVIFW